MSAAPSDKPAEPTTVPAPTVAPPPAAVPSRPPTDPMAKALLAVTAALFFGWLAWLSYAALTKSREPIVPRAQAAVAVPVVAKVDADEKGAPVQFVTVVESLKPDGPSKDTPLVVKLSEVRGFTGRGEYLLLLAPEPHAFLPDGRPVFQLVGPRGAPDSEPPTMYQWTPDVAAQAKRMYRSKD
jgi:hypothetical protein